MFTGDKVEALYGNINKHLLKGGTQSVNIINYSFFFNLPTLDPKNVRYPNARVMAKLLRAPSP